VDEIIATMLNSVVGKAAEKLTELVLDQPWNNDLAEGKQIVQQLTEEYGKKAYISKHVLPALKMRTLHNVDYDVLLDDIYYPLSATVASNNDKLNITNKFTIPFNGVVNIIGIAGQGKSTVLRKLFSEEIKKAERIPFFIELRRVENTDILSHLMGILNSCGVECSVDNLKILLQSKKVVLMLDGFDEVKHTQRIQMMNAITQLHYQFNTPLITSTRPNTEICHASDVYNIYIDDLEVVDKVSILNLLSTNDKFSNDATSFKVLANLICDKEELADTICNPILVTLLYYCYPYMNDIPNNMVEFYRSLFDTLYARHDKIKVYARERKSPIIGDKAKLCFSAICYNSMMDEKFELWGEELLRYAEEAIETEGYAIEYATDFISDIIDITCLIQQEGNNRFVFLHKSVQEFYAAFAVANLPLEYKKEIYPTLLDLIRDSEQLDNFMLFLFSLDSKTFSDEMTIKAFRELGFVDVATMPREKAKLTFDAMMNGWYVNGRSATDEDSIKLNMEFILSPLLNLDIFPILQGSNRNAMDDIDFLFHHLLLDDIKKINLGLFKHEVRKERKSNDSEDRTELEYYSFPIIEFLKAVDGYEELITSYYDTIHKFYTDTYLPAHEISARRLSGLVKNFRIKKR